MSAPDPRLGTWAIHYQSHWRDAAANPKYPMPLRVALVAYGNHRANGHANFKQQELQEILGRFVDGTFYPADRRTIYRAIRQAIEWDLLDQESRAMCLIVPKHHVTGGPGEPDEPCRRHPRASKMGARRGLEVVR